MTEKDSASVGHVLGHVEIEKSHAYDEQKLEKETSLFKVKREKRLRKIELGSLSLRVFETRTATGREHFVFQDSGVSHIFILIISN